MLKNIKIKVQIRQIYEYEIHYKKHQEFSHFSFRNAVNIYYEISK